MLSNVNECKYVSHLVRFLNRWLAVCLLFWGSHASGISAAPELQQAIFKKLQDVPEFQVLVQQAQELDIKAVYLFGGTAAALAHYVRDLEHQRTLKQAQPSLQSIMFQNQDVDIVIDSPEVGKIQQLEKAIKKALPMVDLKWDFWGLHIKYDRRPALLSSPDLAYQHTDSHSTVLIPIYESSGTPLRRASIHRSPNQVSAGHAAASMATSGVAAPTNKNRRRSLRMARGIAPRPSMDRSSSQGWSDFLIYDLRSDDATQFLTDVLEKKLSCYYSAKHRQSPRYKKGDNPEIFFAIRTLTKAFQYGLDIPEDCMNRIQKIFKNFKADRDLKTDYSQYWIEKNAKKLYTHSIDLERSQRVLQQLGALEVLKSIGNTNKMGSMAWWLDRQPLLSRPIHARPVNVLSQKPEADNTADTPPPQTGASTEKNLTAAQLGLHYVVHSTPTIEAFESIVRSQDHQPNAFMSRSNTVGESAVFGEGFYTMRVEDQNTCTHSNDFYGPLGICFRVHPQARQDVDFIWPPDGHIVVFTNKEALRIANDSVLKGIEYFFNSWLKQNGSAKSKLQHIDNEIKKALPFILRKHPDKYEDFINPILEFSSTLKLSKYVSFWAHALSVLPPYYVATHYNKFFPPAIQQSIHNMVSGKTKNRQREGDLFFISLHVTNLTHHIDKYNREQNLTSYPEIKVFANDAFIDDMVDLFRRYFENKKASLSDWVRPEGDGAGRLLHNLLNLYHHESEASGQSSRVLTKLVNTFLEVSESLEGEKYYMFWNDLVRYWLPSRHLAAHYKKYLSAYVKKFIHNNIMATKIDVKSRKEILLLLDYIETLSGLINLHVNKNSTWGLRRDFKGCWHWLFKELLLQLQRLQPHPLSDVKIDPMFEALLARVFNEIREAGDTLFSAVDEYHLDEYYLDTIRRANKADELFEKLVVQNVDYFIRHNNIFILEMISLYIFEHSESFLLPNVRLETLEKIRKHESSLSRDDLTANYEVHLQHERWHIGERVHIDTSEYKNLDDAAASSDLFTPNAHQAYKYSYRFADNMRRKKLYFIRRRIEGGSVEPNILDSTVRQKRIQRFRSQLGCPDLLAQKM